MYASRPKKQGTKGEKMNTQVCIDGVNGQDCLKFTKTGTGQSKGWNFVGQHTLNKMQ